MLQYRAELVIWLISHVLDPVVYLAVWTAVSIGAGGQVGGYGPSQFAAYFIVLMLTNHVTYTWVMFEFEYRVRHGSLLAGASSARSPHPFRYRRQHLFEVITLPLIIVAAVILGLIFRPMFSIPGWAAAAYVPALFLPLPFASSWNGPSLWRRFGRHA